MVFPHFKCVHLGSVRFVFPCEIICSAKTLVLLCGLFGYFLGFVFWCKITYQ